MKLNVINDKPRNDALNNIKIWNEYISNNKPTTTCIVKYEPYRNDDNIGYTKISDIIFQDITRTYTEYEGHI